jgi:hypothetical protein
VYYAASEMQLLENDIRRFKDNKLTVLIGADNDGPSRRKEGKAVWEETKNPRRRRWIQGCCRN